MPVITIAREFGAGGSSVAAMLAQRLEAEVIDRRLVAEVAGRLGFTADAVAAQDEHAKSVVDRLVRSFAALGEAYGTGWDVRYGEPLADPQEAVQLLTEQVIRQTARRGNAIIIGRGGAFVLADWPDALHVFLRSAESVRIRAIMARFALAEEEARHAAELRNGLARPAPLRPRARHRAIGISARDRHDPRCGASVGRSLRKALGHSMAECARRT